MIYLIVNSSTTQRSRPLLRNRLRVAGQLGLLALAFAVGPTSSSWQSPLLAQEAKASKTETPPATEVAKTTGAADAQESPRRFLEVNNAILKTLESTTIAAQTAGIISSLETKEGYPVKPGQELGRIRDNAVRLQVARAKAALDVAQAKQIDDIDERLAQKSLAVAENEYQRALKANSRVPDSYPINEIDRLKLVADRCRLEVERAVNLRKMAGLETTIADTEYRQALELQERHRVQAPVSGVVVSLEKHVGEWVELGAPLLKVERIDRLRVEGFVSAADAMRKIVGQTATVSHSLPTGTIEAKGKVVFVSPSIDPILSTARVFIEIENADALFRPGLGVRASIELP